MGVHLLGKPGDERGEAALGQRGGDAGPLGRRGLEQLCRCHRAEGVGGKVAEGAVIPVDVLQAAAAIVGHLEAKQGLDARVPCARQVSHREVAGHQGAFEPPAQDDMGRIGHLIGLDADEACAHPPPEPRKVGWGVGRRIAAEGRVHARPEPGEERVGARGLHLDDQALALMRGHAARLAQGAAREGRGQVRLVERMTAFVQHAEDGLGRVGLVIAGGDADVGGRAAAEGVGALVEPCGGEIEAGALCQRAAEGALRGHRERACERDGRGRGRLAGQNLWQDLAQHGFERPEHGLDPRIAEPGLEPVHQRIVGREAGGGGKCRGLFAHQPHHLGEQGSDGGEVGCLPRRAPRGLAGRIGPRDGLDEVGWERGGAAMLAAHQGEVGAIGVCEALSLGFGGDEFLRRLGGGERRVRHGREGGHLLAPRGRGFRRHHHRRVPMQDGGGFLERSEPREAGAQPVVGGKRGHDGSCRARSSRLRAQNTKNTASAAASPNQVMA